MNNDLSERQDSLNILSGLNNQQRAAVSAPMDQHIQVVAGAGTGKTSVLTQRISWCVSHGVPPWQIMAVTFTNKAAKEMRERLIRSIGESRASRVQMGTFHSIGMRILRRHHGAAGLSATFAIIDKDEQKILMTRVAERFFGLNGSTAMAERFRAENRSGKLVKWQQDQVFEQKREERDKADHLMKIIGRWKQKDLYPPEKVIPMLGIAGFVSPARQEALDAYVQYEAEKERHGGLDFDDLILRVNHLFRMHPGVLGGERARVRVLLCDEFQDVNIVQTNFIQYLSGTMMDDAAPTAWLFIVGDADQSIYGWRGSRPDMMQHFAQTMGMEKFMLEQNYRCSPVVLDAANAVIAHNMDREEKHLFTQRVDAPPIALFRAEKEGTTEERWVTDTMEAITRSGKGSYSDMAVLYRAKSTGYALTREMVRRGIPYKVFGDSGFYGATEIKDAVAWLRVVFNPNDDAALLRAVSKPPCGIGHKTLDDLEKTAEITGLSIHTVMSGPSGFSKSSAIGPFLDKVANLRRAYVNQPFEQFVESVLRYSDPGMPSRLSLLDYHGKDGEKGEDRAENLLSLVGMSARFASSLKMGGKQGGDPDESLAHEPGDPLSEFLAEMALMTATETADAGEASAVSLMTVHKAKGLEFPQVFVLGCMEGFFPHRQGKDPEGNCEDLEEERRLFYVAITRSKQGLFLSASKKPMTYGQGCYHGDFPLSQFVCEIPERLFSDAVQNVIVGMTVPSLPVQRKAIPVSPSSAATKVPQTATGDVGLLEYPGCQQELESDE
ncbi:ATP-dependent helicase [Acidithiobacillus sp. MC6.1]|nr:ATP-dependent helicase [Acidithiobacillus sp. MC6.1]